MHASKRELRLSHTRKSCCVCATCEVRCSALPVAHKGIATSCKRNFCKHSKITDVLPHHVDEPLQSVEDEADEDTKSIATGFPILDVGDFVGWEELEGRLFDTLFFKVTDRSDGVRIIRSCFHGAGSTLYVLKPVFKYSHTSAALPTLRCRSGPHVRSCQDVCRYLRSIRWLAAILGACRFCWNRWRIES